MPDVSIFPGLVSVATRRGHAAPLAAWHLARAMDEPGAGRVMLDDLRAAGMKLWSRSKCYSAIREAARLGLVDLVARRSDGARVVRLRSLARVAEIFNIADVGARPVLARVSALKTAGTFRAAVFCAVHAGRQGDTARPISRATLQDLTGIGRRTQTRYERRNNDRRNGQVYRRPNFAVLGYGPDALRAIRDTTYPGAYLYGGAVVRPLPNSYSSTLTVASGSKLRKVNRTLMGGLVVGGAGQHTRAVLPRCEVGPAGCPARSLCRKRPAVGFWAAVWPAFLSGPDRIPRGGRVAGVWRAC